MLLTVPSFVPQVQHEAPPLAPHEDWPVDARAIGGNARDTLFVQLTCHTSVAAPRLCRRAASTYPMSCERCLARGAIIVLFLCRCVVCATPCGSYKDVGTENPVLLAGQLFSTREEQREEGRARGAGRLRLPSAAPPPGGAGRVWGYIKYGSSWIL